VVDKGKFGLNFHMALFLPHQTWNQDLWERSLLFSKNHCFITFIYLVESGYIMMVKWNQFMTLNEQLQKS